MKYIISFRKRGELTDDQKDGLFKKLKLKLIKEKDAGSTTKWLVNTSGKLAEEDLAKALKFFKISKEVSNPEVSEA